MHRGYVKLWRKSLESAAFQTDGMWRLWTWCLMKASHQKRVVGIKIGRGEAVVEVQAGQFIFGRTSAAKELRLRGGTLYDRMVKLAKHGNINIQPHTHYSIVTICNWTSYQAAEDDAQQPSQQQTNSKPTANQQQTNTDKNGKNGGDSQEGQEQPLTTNHYPPLSGASTGHAPDMHQANTVQAKRKPFVKPTLAEVAAYCLERKNGINPQEFLDANDAKGWVVGSTQTPMKDWQAAIRTWEANRKKGGMFNGRPNRGTEGAGPIICDLSDDRYKSVHQRMAERAGREKLVAGRPAVPSPPGDGEPGTA